MGGSRSERRRWQAAAGSGKGKTGWRGYYSGTDADAGVVCDFAEGTADKEVREEEGCK